VDVVAVVAVETVVAAEVVTVVAEMTAAEI
jgi:hypothetical protein